jgi:hypothetical protein
MKAVPLIALLTVFPLCLAEDLNLHYVLDSDASKSNDVVLRQGEKAIAWSRAQGDSGPLHTLQFTGGEKSDTVSNVAFDFSAPEQATWSGVVNGRHTQGKARFLVGDQGIVVEILDGESDFRVQFETEQTSLEQVGFAIVYSKAKLATCYCFGDSSLGCSDSQCNEALECPGGNGGPKCRWGAAVEIIEIPQIALP